MEQPEALSTTEATVQTQAIWETLTAAQQETVLQTIVRICCQIVEQWMPEAGHESE